MQASQATNPSIFFRLRAPSLPGREMAWGEFVERYRPMIVQFARRLSLQSSDADDVAQEVILGFFSRSPSFVYDPEKGRFRHYLLTCTRHAVHRRYGHRVAPASPLLDDVAIEATWEDVWETQALRMAVETLRAEAGQTKAFQAFERFVMLEQPASEVAQALDLHLNSVYRARDQVVQMLHRKLRDLQLDLE